MIFVSSFDQKVVLFRRFFVFGLIFLFKTTNFNFDY